MNCEKCGAELVQNPKTGKWFCKEKCWLKGQNNNTSVQKTNGKGADYKTMLLAYAKDLEVAKIQAGKDGNMDNLIKNAERMKFWYNG